MIARRREQVFKPSIDVRYSSTEIVSHADLRMKSEVVEDVRQILALTDPRTQVVGIDEANFLGAGLVDVAQTLADGGKQVIIAGLDTDYMGRPCMRCGNPAKHTQRLVESNDLIVVGASGMYEARCRACFEPGIPAQEYLEFARPRLRSSPGAPPNGE